MDEILTKDGPLSPIWLAGTMKDKIGKKVVLATDITKVSNQILNEDRLSLVLRLSGMLLKGVVIMYSKKVQYMLIDCEEVITKIKESFKPIQVNLPGGEGKSITLGTEEGNKLVLDPVHDITEWIAAQNPEETFQVTSIPLNLQSQPSTEPNSELSSQFSQSTDAGDTPQLTPVGELDEAFHPPNSSPRPSLNKPPTTWADIPDDDDAGDIAPNIPSETSHSTTDNEEGNTENETRKIMDNKINMKSKEFHAKERPKARRPKATMPQNEELNQLFELGASQSTRTSTAGTSKAESPVMSDDMNDGIEINLSEGPEFNREAEPETIPTPKISTPNLADLSFELPSNNPTPFEDGKYKFAVEPTPLPKLEDSIDSNTKKTLIKLQSIIPNEGDKTTFQEAYQGSSKHQSALAFYQMLVLKSAKAIEIKQDNPLKFSPIEITQDERFHMFG